MSTRSEAESRPVDLTTRASSGASALSPADGVASARQKARWSSRRSGAGTEYLCFDHAGPLGLGEDLLELRDVIVPLDEGGDAAEARERVTVERPDCGDHRRVVRVEEVRPAVAV